MRGFETRVNYLDFGVLRNLAQDDGAAFVGRADTKSCFVHLHQ